MVHFTCANDLDAIARDVKVVSTGHVFTSVLDALDGGLNLPPSLNEAIGLRRRGLRFERKSSGGTIPGPKHTHVVVMETLFSRQANLRGDGTANSHIGVTIHTLRTLRFLFDWHASLRSSWSTPILVKLGLTKNRPGGIGGCRSASLFKGQCTPSERTCRCLEFGLSIYEKCLW